MKTCTRLFVSLFLLMIQTSSFATAQDFDKEIAAIIRAYDSAWLDSANNGARSAAYGAVVLRADALTKQYPARGELLVWKGMAQAEQSGAEGSLGLAKQARKTLEAATSAASNPYTADAYATLGAMYANIPGFPLAFGDKKKAQELYQRALAINPSSISANLGYARLLLKKGDYASTVKHASVALAAPTRPGRERADADLRSQAEKLIAIAKAASR